MPKEPDAEARAEGRALAPGGTGHAAAALHPAPAVAARLERFVELLLAGNAKVNLTAARDRDAVAAHIHDALTLVPYVGEGLVDVGSGGGFPAIPLAVVSGIAPTLIEANGKKARFLQEANEALGLHARVVPARAEAAGRDPALRERFDWATARAVGTLPTVLELTVPFLRLGGRAVLQRGRLSEPERAAALDAALVLGAAFVEEVPAGGERRILIFEKRSATGPRFPRRSGVPDKRPLCLKATPQALDEGDADG
jgi:16S rRNA (guanine527-N7)-methyltransferase